MKSIKKIFLAGMCLAFSICIWNSYTLVSEAEEITPPGYHVYSTTEHEVIDTWYGVARGTYLESGTVGLVDAGKARVNVSGGTDAHSVCDVVKAGVYLDESTNGGSSFGTIGVYHYQEENALSCHGSKANIAVTSGRWYMVRGVHTVIEGSTTETTTTQTYAMKAS